MSARDVIAEELEDEFGRYADERADDILSALHAAGYRLIGPGELDRETVERCAEVADRREQASLVAYDRIGSKYWEGSASSASDIAAALRSLQGGE